MRVCGRTSGQWNDSSNLTGAESRQLSARNACCDVSEAHMFQEVWQQLALHRFEIAFGTETGKSRYLEIGETAGIDA